MTSADASIDTVIALFRPIEFSNTATSSAPSPATVLLPKVQSQHHQRETRVRHPVLKHRYLCLYLD